MPKRKPIIPTSASPRMKRINPMDIHVGQQIRIARLAADMSQEKLADALGVSFQQVQKYEKGTNRVSGSRLSQIANALGVAGVEVFFNGGPGYANGGKKSDPAVYSMLATSDGLQMVKLWERLTPNLRRTVLNLTSDIVSQ